MDQAKEDPKENERKERNAKLKEKARQVIVREEKKLYKEEYDSVIMKR